jgi:hypothetical protein
MASGGKIDPEQYELDKDSYLFRFFFKFGKPVAAPLYHEDREEMAEVARHFGYTVREPDVAVVPIPDMRWWRAYCAEIGLTEDEYPIWKFFFHGQAFTAWLSAEEVKLMLA